MFQITTFFILVYCFQMQYSAYAQNDKLLNQNEGGIPKVAFYELKGDSVLPLTSLKRAESTTVYVKVIEGLEHVLYNQLLSSNEAIVEKSADERNVYYVTPLGIGICELILDIKLMEEYHQVAFEKEGKRMVKKVIRIYTPRMYMIDYIKLPIVD